VINAIIFDWKRTLYDPDKGSLIVGARDILELIKQHHIPLELIGKGGDEMYAEVDRLGVREYFADIVFHPDSKDRSLFEPKVQKSDPQATLFIGDRVRSELAIGNALHGTTIWLRQGKFADELPENETQNPTYVVSSLAELGILLQKIFLNPP
jgi:FMN phosphatase YigB (HAD superfamily)